MAATNDANQPLDNRQPRNTPARPQTQQTPAILNAAPRPESLLRCLRRRLILAVSLALLLAVLAGAGVWMAAPEPKHAVRTRLRNPPGNPLLQGVERVPAIQDHQRNEVALARSGIVFTTALRNPEVMKLSLDAKHLEPVAWLEQNVQVDFSVAPEIMQISMVGTQTEELAVLVKAVRDAYLAEVGDRDRSFRVQKLQFLTELIQKYEDRLRNERDAQKDLAEKIGGKNPNVRAANQRFLQQRHARTEQNLLVAQNDLFNLRQALKHLREKQEKGGEVLVPEAVVLEALDKDRQIAKRRAQVEVLQGQIRETVKRAVDPERETAGLRRELATVEKEIADLTERLRPLIVKQYRERALVSLQQELASTAERVAVLEKDEASLQAELKTLTEKLADFDKLGNKVDLATENVEHIEKMVKQFRTDAANLQIAMAVPNRITPLEDVSVQRVDGRTRRMMMAGGAALGAFCFVLFGVAWLEYRARRVETVDEVVLGLGFRLVGTVPQTPPRSRSQVAPGGKKGGLSQVHTESVDAVRTTLLHLVRLQTVRTVMVTSAVAAEGKTTLSCHLAASLARAGLRTLLIDGDGRNPNVHKLFKITPGVGFGEVLCGECQPAEAIHATPVRGLAVMPAGTWSDKVLLAISQGRVAELMQQLRQDYDLILVDSSPVLPVADPLVIGQQVDGVLLSVLCQVTRLTNLYAASHRIEELGVNILGVVVSGVQANLYGSSYRYPYPRRRAAQSQGEEKGGRA